MVGILGYNCKLDRYGLLVMDCWAVQGFCCGTVLDIWDYDSDSWFSARLERHATGEWYFVGTNFHGDLLEGLKVRF